MDSLFRQALNLASSSEAIELEDNEKFLALESTLNDSTREILIRQQSLEALDSYRYVLEKLLSTESYSAETAVSICAEAISVAKNIGAEITLPSLESGDGQSIRIYHEVALEGVVDAIRNFVDTTLQAAVMQWKHAINAITDLFKTAEEETAKYEMKLKKTHAEFNSKRRGFRDGEHHQSLAELWYFFTDAGGPTADVLTALEKDTRTSKYILVEYFGEVTKQLEALSRTLNSARITDVSAAKRFLKDFDKYKNTDDLYKEQFLGDRFLLNATSVVRSPSSVNKPKSFAGQDWSHIADLSTFVSIKEKSSIKHTADKVGYQLLASAPVLMAWGQGAAAKNAMAAVGTALQGGAHFYKFSDIPPMKISTSGIEDVIEYGLEYISNARNFLSKRSETTSRIEKLVEAVDKLDGSDFHTSLGDKDGSDFHKVLRQIIDFADNNVKAIKNPCTDELKRTIRGAKYCNYLALRLIWNASNYL